MFRPSKQKRIQKHFSEPNPGFDNLSGYPFRLNFYDLPPVQEITLEEFELWAIDRLYGIIL